jgi:beta-lactamase superfamily II metal-dependent hydrolase
MARVRTRGGAGCALAVLAILLGAGALVSYKFGLLWWKKKDAPPAPSGKELQVHVLNVGQGDAILIISPEGKSVLVDAGEASRAKMVIDALNRYNVQKLDYFIATHPHPDHIGGAAEVIKAKGVGTVIESGAPLPENETSLEPSPTPPAQKGKAAAPPVRRKPVNEEKLPNKKADTEFHDAVKQAGAQLVTAAPGQKYDLGGGARLVVFAPIQPFFTKAQMSAGGNEPNANSVVVRLDYGDFSMWLPGDAEVQTESRLLGQEMDERAVQILKVAHHGSGYATSDDFLKRLKPEVAIISVGADNLYGHPQKKLLERLRKAGITQLYRTDLEGEVTITTTGKLKDGKLYEIKPEREAKADELWVSPEDKKPQHKDDSSRSGFIAYPATSPPRTPPGQKKQ